MIKIFSADGTQGRRRKKIWTSRNSLSSMIKSFYIPVETNRA